MNNHTPGSWHKSKTHLGAAYDIGSDRGDNIGLLHGPDENGTEEFEANANLVVASPFLLKACRLHKAWADAEKAGPDYGGQTRYTHPDGESIWRQWWGANLSLCEHANTTTDIAIAVAEGRLDAEDATRRLR